MKHIRMLTHVVLLFVTTLVVGPARALVTSEEVEVKITTGDHEPRAILENPAPIMGIVATGSTMTNSGVGDAQVETVGTASLVQIGEGPRLVALTAAHVVAGQKPWVEVNGQVIYPKQVLFDSTRDIALLDLGTVDAKPAFIYNTKNISAAPEFMKAVEQARIPTVMLAYYAPGHALGFALRPWVDEGVESAHTRSVLTAPIVSMNYDASMIRIHTKVTGGASGSSVMDLRQKKVIGLVTQSGYYFSETYLASEESLLRHFSEFLAGKRDQVDGTRWKMRNKLSYQVYEDGTEETSFVQKAVNGIIGSPGGVVGPPGRGVIGSPGRGVIGSPGRGVVGPPGRGVIGPPGKEEAAPFLPWTQDPRSLFDYFQIQPGILWKGQEVIGFKVRTLLKNPVWPDVFTLLGEAEGIRFLKGTEDTFEVTPIPTKTNYLELLRSRLGLKPGERKVVKAYYGPSAIANDFELRPFPDECTLTVSEKSVVVQVKTYSKMDRKKWKLVPDTIRFTLFENGSDGTQAGFRPIIQTKGLQSNEDYFVDLRRFFFADISQVIRPMPDWSADNPPYDQSRFDLIQQLKTIGFAVRNAKSGAEFSYGFLPQPEK